MYVSIISLRNEVIKTNIISFGFYQAKVFHFDSKFHSEPLKVSTSIANKGFLQSLGERDNEHLTNPFQCVNTLKKTHSRQTYCTILAINKDKSR